MFLSTKKIKIGIRNFAFYDDALLVDEEYITSYLEKIILKGIEARFYTPNGLHARYVTEKTARLMKKAHFTGPILSLETVKNNNPGSRHNKVTKEDLENAVFFFKKAGYKVGEYWVYLMLGAPGDSLEDVKDSIEFVNSLGGKVSLSEFSPIPGTPAAAKFTKTLKEPLLQNNSIFPLFDQTKWKDIRFLKHYAHELNSSLF
ncbi:MAG: radical SAM protein [Candidatus Omnitrophica bacterium]|nr:radical SAM protein [Candidatus Omnitrophota bacterium]